MAEDIVALLGEGEFVDGVMNEAGLQQVACVAASVAPVNKALDVAVQPVHHLRTCAKPTTALCSSHNFMCFSTVSVVKRWSFYNVCIPL